MTSSHPVQFKEISFIVIHHVLAHDSCLFQPKRKSFCESPALFGHCCSLKSH